MSHYAVRHSAPVGPKKPQRDVTVSTVEDEKSEERANARKMDERKLSGAILRTWGAGRNACATKPESGPPPFLSQGKQGGPYNGEETQEGGVKPPLQRKEKSTDQSSRLCGHGAQGSCVPTWRRGLGACPSLKPLRSKPFEDRGKLDGNGGGRYTW
jgi:hypothetical protein